ncbi:MAG: InlB B-repeat-containing protein, partial [Oscillospiraceae bacterium]|nr:InlB B-repeat-containing protein [Oscillospiraceae bacterium]
TEITEEQTKIYRTVTIDDAINGLVTSSVDKALAGTTVMFSVADYRIDVSTLKVNDGAVELTAVNDIWYAFTMPAADVTVTAEVVQSNVDGDMLTGSIRHTVTIVDGASITLNNATITGGIVCEGSATITLVGTNSVSGPTFKAGIQIGGSGTTLTIKGNGSLTANGYDQSAGIGLSRAWNPASDVIGGDIVIEGGNITANGGSQWGAGIGTGVIFGNGSAKTARIGNITIKGGTVKATGGTSADGIGTGYAYSGCTNAIGTVTIYDGINLVDASSIKDFGSVVYMHGENDITANASDYFAINGSTITLKDYNLTTTGEHGTITAKVGDTSAATAHYGDTVTLNVTPDEGYVLKSLTVKDADENEIEVENNQFNMPLKDVTITAEFVPIEYTISYELGDAQNSPSNPASYTVESEDIILAAPTGDDSFEGWYDNATFKGEPVTKIEKGSRGDITLYAKFGDMSIEQASLTLNGDIGVTVDMSIPEKYTGGEYYMTISTPRQATKECSLSDALIAENGLYRFTFYVAAKEMTDSIDFTLTNGTDNVKTESVSVRDVALSYLAEETKYQKEIPLVKAMLNYGAYAQEFLNYTNDDHLANKGFEDSRIDALTADELQKYAYKTEYSNLPEGVTCTGVSLSLKSEMALNLTFNNTTGKKLTFAVPSGYEVTTSGTGKKIKVKVTGIKAEYIGNDVEVSVTFDGQSGYYQKYNPMTFGYNRIKANDPEAGLSKAMYYYYLAADEYINS